MANSVRGVAERTLCPCGGGTPSGELIHGIPARRLLVCRRSASRAGKNESLGIRRSSNPNRFLLPVGLVDSVRALNEVAMLFKRRLVSHGHVHHFTVSHAGAGWDVCEEEDSRVIQQVHHDDWHRVERKIHRFDDMAAALRDEGWTEQRQKFGPFERS